jgi:cobalamin biosynthesis protein CobC
VEVGIERLSANSKMPGDIDPRFYERSRRLDLARTLYLEAPEPWVDLSMAISPWGYPAPAACADDIRRGPDAAALQALEAVARRAYRAPPAADVVAVPGVDAGLSVLPWLFRSPKRVAVLAPPHADHAAAWEAAGHSVSEIASLDHAGGAAILVAVNPSHIDGRFVPHADLAASIPPLKRRDGLLVIDETFADADDVHTLLPAVARLDYSLVLRSLGPFYGASGVGLGFAITSHPIAGRLRSALGLSPISAQALTLGHAALKDDEWAAAQRGRLAQAAAGLDATLAAAGLRVAGSGPTFRLVACSDHALVFDRLARHGILAQPFRDLRALRLGFPRDDGELSRLRAALSSR